MAAPLLIAAAVGGAVLLLSRGGKGATGPAPGPGAAPNLDGQAAPTTEVKPHDIGATVTTVGAGMAGGVKTAPPVKTKPPITATVAPSSATGGVAPEDIPGWVQGWSGFQTTLSAVAAASKGLTPAGAARTAFDAGIAAGAIW